MSDRGNILNLANEALGPRSAPESRVVEALQTDKPCPECGAPVDFWEIGDPSTAAENAPIGEVRCTSGHVVVRFLRPDQAAIDRGRELAEKYGW